MSKIVYTSEEYRAHLLASGVDVLLAAYIANMLPKHSMFLAEGGMSEKYHGQFEIKLFVPDSSDLTERIDCLHKNAVLSDLIAIVEDVCTVPAFTGIRSRMLHVVITNGKLSSDQTDELISALNLGWVYDSKEYAIGVHNDSIASEAAEDVSTETI